MARKGKLGAEETIDERRGSLETVIQAHLDPPPLRVSHFAHIHWRADIAEGYAEAEHKPAGHEHAMVLRQGGDEGAENDREGAYEHAGAAAQVVIGGADEWNGADGACIQS